MWHPVDGQPLLHLFDARDDDDCESGKQFYHCGSNGFRGCCSVDPCDLEDCPDTPKLPSGVFFTGFLPGADGENERVSTSLTTTMSTTSKETTSTTTTTTLASTLTLTQTEEATLSEEPAPVTVTSVTEIRVTEIGGHLTTLTTILREVMTETETETTKEILTETTREVSTETKKEVYTTSLPHVTLSRVTLAATSASSSTAINRDDVIDANRNAGSGDDTRNGGLSEPQIGGIAGGVAAFLILMAVLAFLLYRRRAADRAAREPATQSAEGQVSSNTPSIEDKDGATETVESPNGQDPFAAFGGRADEMVHEMDTIPQRIPELPGHQTTAEQQTVAGQPVMAGQQTTAGQPTARPTTTPSTQQPMAQAAGPGASIRQNDPRATLNETVNDEGRPAYVNHWSQYR